MMSNADSERMFSMMKKIATEFRSELNNDTICALLCTKQNSLYDCFDFLPSEEILKNAKSACCAYKLSLKQ